MAGGAETPHIAASPAIMWAFWAGTTSSSCNR